MEVEDRPLEGLDEGVEGWGSRRDPVVPHVRLAAGLAERLPELRAIVGRRGHQPQTGRLTGRHIVARTITASTDSPGGVRSRWIRLPRMCAKSPRPTEIVAPSPPYSNSSPPWSTKK